MLKQIKAMTTVCVVGLSAIAVSDGQAMAGASTIPGEGAVGIKVLPVIPTWETHAGKVGNAPAFSTPGGSIFTPLASTLVGSITPAANADTVGMWTSLDDWPVVAIHASVLPNGHVLTFGTPVGVSQQNSEAFDDWDPSRGLVQAAHVVTANPTSINSFCGASKLFLNGQLFVSGGNSATTTASWNESSHTYSAVTATAPLLFPRWYASLVRLPDNRMLTIGGGVPYVINAYLTPTDNSQVSTTPEIYAPSTGWSQLNGANSAEAFGAQDNRWWYPRAYVAPDGSVFGVSHNVMWSLDPSAGSIRILGQLTTTGVGANATSAMYDTGKILLAGGGNHNNYETAPNSNQATVIDINGPVPVAAPAAPMHFARGWSTAVTLPTGKVLVLGGTQTGNNGGADAVYPGEIWDPSTGSWTQTAPASAIRVYHSTAILLPDGSILNAGGGVPGPVDNFNAQIYFPPYLFARQGSSVVWAQRPSIVGLSAVPSYGSLLGLTLNRRERIASVSLVSLAAETHSHNTDQRRIAVRFFQFGRRLTAMIPRSANILPPGYYQLHVVNAAGVPSAGVIIELKV